MLESDPEQVLRSANRRLSELLHLPPLRLAEGGAQALGDSLWVWGILGGKEVGKTTLINALAGGEVVPPGREVGEGTFQPAAYSFSGDAAPLRARFAALEPMSITYHSCAPPALRGVVLVDLPDFDSLYEDHVDQVRRIAPALDGIIWVTTPKKLGDLRGITEIQRVLKARSNFVYAVNKIDWLLSQAKGPPQQELDRLASALEQQVAECDPGGGPHRAFLVTAKYRERQAILEAIARQRDLPGADSLTAGNGDLAKAAERVLREFDALTQALTTPPTAETATANKRANLAYQVHRQAAQLLDYYQPRRVLEKIERAADPDAVLEIVGRSFHPAYCSEVFERLNSGQPLLADWSSSLFRARIAHWALLGIVAWPLAMVGALLRGLRHLLPEPSAAAGDSFRSEGLPLEERAEAVLDRVGRELAAVQDRVTVNLPDAATLAGQFRSEAASLARDHRSLVIEPLLQRRPSALGRVLRWIVPVAVLLWFPLVQPVLDTALAGVEGGMDLNVELARALVKALSAANVLTGLAATLVILAMLVATVYSRAVGDARRAIDRLDKLGPQAVAESLVESLANTVRRPIEQTRAQLSDATDAIGRLAGIPGHP